MSAAEIRIVNRKLVVIFCHPPISPIVYTVAEELCEILADIAETLSKIVLTLCMGGDVKRHDAKVHHANVLRTIDKKF